VEVLEVLEVWGILLRFSLQLVIEHHLTMGSLVLMGLMGFLERMGIQEAGPLEEVFSFLEVVLMARLELTLPGAVVEVEAAPMEVNFMYMSLGQSMILFLITEMELVPVAVAVEKAEEPDWAELVAKELVVLLVFLSGTMALMVL